jgi:protein SCO1/2
VKTSAANGEAMRLRSALWLVTLIAGLVVGGLVILHAASQPQSGTLSTSGTARIGGPFQLVDQDGHPVNQNLLRGRWSLVFFGYTYCPDVCPTTLQALAQAQDQLGPNGRDVQVVFVSVDPQRDTPAQLKMYLSAQGMPRNVIGLTGTPQQVAAMAHAYAIYYARQGTGEGYTVNHSTVTYLMNPQGRLAQPIPYGLAPTQIADQIRAAMRGA